MNNYPIDFSLPENKKLVLELKVLKRRFPLNIKYVKEDIARNYIHRVNGFIFFYRFFETRFALKHGDVLLATFDGGCGNELQGSHYCVVLLDSSAANQVVTIIPLKSNKGRELNPASDILLGDIPEMINCKEAVAIINQIRTIDKRRFFNQQTIENLERLNYSSDCNEFEASLAQNKSVFRLTKEQYEKLHTAVKQYIFNGFIKHNE